MESKFLRLHSLFGNHIERLEGSRVDQCLEMVFKFQCETFQLDCSPSLPTEPLLRLEAAKSTTEFAQLGSSYWGPYN